MHLKWLNLFLSSFDGSSTADSLQQDHFEKKIISYIQHYKENLDPGFGW